MHTAILSRKEHRTGGTAHHTEEAPTQGVTGRKLAAGQTATVERQTDDEKGGDGTSSRWRSAWTQDPQKVKSKKTKAETKTRTTQKKVKDKLKDKDKDKDNHTERDRQQEGMCPVPECVVCGETNTNTNKGTTDKDKDNYTEKRQRRRRDVSSTRMCGVRPLAIMTCFWMRGSPWEVRVGNCCRMPTVGGRCASEGERRRRKTYRRRHSDSRVTQARRHGLEGLVVTQLHMAPLSHVAFEFCYVFPSYFVLVIPSLERSREIPRLRICVDVFDGGDPHPPLQLRSSSTVTLAPVSIK